MKMTKRILCLLFAAAMTVGLLSACESAQEKMEKLSGVWTLTEEDSEEQALALLENIDFYEEEIALVDLTSLYYVQNVEFTVDGHYSFAFDVEGTKECVRRFYEGVFDALYEGRAALNETYGEEFDRMSRDEFDLFYADLYAYTDFDVLIEHFVDIAYAYDTLGEAWETGTYTIDGDEIMCTITGESQAEALGYKIDGNTLILAYADAVEVYTRGN